MPEAMKVADWLDCESDLFTMFSSQHLKLQTLLTKVQLPLGFIYIKVVLGLHLTVNKKSQRRYTLLSRLKAGKVYSNIRPHCMNPFQFCIHKLHSKKVMQL